MEVKNRRILSLLCYTGAFIGPFGGNVVNILIPRLQKQFNTSFYDISLSISVYMIAFASFQLISGIISDIMGRRNVVLFGYSIFGIGSIICFFAPGLSLFLAGRFIQGASNAFMTPVLMALLGDIVPREKLGTVMGIFGSVQTSGIFLAPLLGGVLAGINWRYVFILLGAISFLLTFIYYKFFIYTSREKKRRLMHMSTFKSLTDNKGILLLSLSSFMGYFGFGSLGFLFAKYIYINVGVSESINGFMVSLTGLGSILFSPLAGRLTDRFNKVFICRIGICGIVPLILMVPNVINPIILSAILFTIGAFSSMVWSSLNAIAVDTLPEVRGTASSIVNSFKYFSFSISPVFYGLIYERSGMRDAFSAAAFSTIIQLIIMTVYDINLRRKSRMVPVR